MEHKTAPAFLKRLDDKGSGVAVIASLTLPGAPPVIDKDGDLTLPGAFDSPVVPVVGSHRWDQPPIGKASIREEGSEVVADFRLNLATDGGREWYEALRFDFEHPPAKAEWSYGFSIPPGGAEFQTLEDGRRVRVLKRLQIFEVSPVLAGAGVGTRTLALKSAADREDPISTLIGALRTLDRAALTAHLESLPREQQQAWMIQAQGLLAETAFLATSLEYETFSEGKRGYRYIDVPLWEDRPRLAAEVVAAACKELGCAFPKSVRFFTATDDAERADFMGEPMLVGKCSNDGAIGLSWDLLPEELVRVAAHEAAHLRSGDEPSAESFAEQFAHQHATKMLGTQPTVNPLEVLWSLSVMRKWYGPVVPYVHI